MFRIFGPPGTGKTTRLLNMVDEALADGVAPQKIAFLAFTRKAAHEARDRAAARFALNARNELTYFRTLHSLAYRTLAIRDTDMMMRSNYEELRDEIGVLLSGSDSLSDEDNLTQSGGDHPIMTIINLSRLKCQSLRQTYNESEIEETWLEVSHAAEAYEQYKKENGLLDFTDMLTVFGNEIDLVCPEFDLCFLDEAQDLSPLQWQIAHGLDRRSKKMFIAGDDDQAIFRWAGASVSHFINLECGAEVLEQSYRIPRMVHNLAERVAHRIEGRYPKKYLPRDEPGTVEYIHDIDELDMGNGDWLIMAQANYMLSPVVSEMKRMGYLFERNGYRSISQKISLAVNGWEQLRKGNEIGAESVKALYSFLSGNGKRIARGKKTVRLNEDELVTMEDLQRDHGLLIGGDVPWYDALDKLPSTDRVYITAILRSGEKFNAKPRIKLSTIHGTKGGEADNVVLFTDLSPAAANHSDPNDIHRLFYVGVTRPKQNLFIVYADNEERSYTL